MGVILKTLARLLRSAVQLRGRRSLPSFVVVTVYESAKQKGAIPSLTISTERSTGMFFYPRRKDHLRTLFLNPAVGQCPPTSCKLIPRHPYAVVDDFDFASGSSWPDNFYPCRACVVGIGYEFQDRYPGINRYWPGMVP